MIDDDNAGLKLGCTIQELHALRSIKSTLTFSPKKSEDKALFSNSLFYFQHFLLHFPETALGKLELWLLRTNREVE